MKDSPGKQERTEHLNKILANLDTRISRIEHHLNLQQIGNEEKTSKPEAKEMEEVESLEYQIGLYWFAKVGIVALITGSVFLLLQPYGNMTPFFAPLLGYVLAGVVLLFFQNLRKSSPLLAGYLLGSGLVLSFFATLRLHFFTNNPALAGTTIESVLLLLVCGAAMIVSLLRKSIYLAAISITMGYVAALLGDATYPFFAISAVMAVLVVYLVVKNAWDGLAIYAIALTYTAHFFWFINNPLAGNPVELRSSSFASALLVLVWISIFAAAGYLRAKNAREGGITLAGSLLNCVGGYGLYLFITVAEYQDRLLVSHFIASTLFIALAAAYWMRQRSRYLTFFYAMTGYAALSVAIVAGFKSPDFFVWLCWQSLLVVSTAVWFKSKFIVVANFVIFAIVFIAHLLFAASLGVTSISFGVVALLSARVLNWQRNRLDLKTDLMRNAYMIAAFIIIPYALYNTVPLEYVSLSWLGLAIAYYVISLILKNMKYRWLALLTFLATAFYLLVVGITKLEPVFRIVSFLVLGIVLLVISFVYNRVKGKSSMKKE